MIRLHFPPWLLVLCSTLLTIGAWTWHEVWYWSRYDAPSLMVSTPHPSRYAVRVSSADRPEDDAPEFFPGTVHSVQGKLPIARLDAAQSCGLSGCHPDIARQWQQSMHHFASFNNPLYRRSVDETRAQQGDAGARWCAGCHDPVMLLSGNMDVNVPSDAIHTEPAAPRVPRVITPESPGAQAGVTCLICHSIVNVQDLTGNGRYTVDAPELASLEPSHPLSPLLHTLLKAYPRAHKAGLSRGLLQEPELCVGCHRVGLTPAQNHFRWLRGQDQYGSWLNGGASGRVARSFYTPEKPQRCQDCHMPLVASLDAGNDNGMVRSHAFPGANTAIPALQNLPEQAQLNANFLKESVRIDLFAIRRLGPDELSVEEQWHFPLEEQTLLAGERVALDVVVRNVRVGHNFPEGVLDNKDVWLELVALDPAGKEVWRQGGLNARGDLLPGAHLYAALLLDQHGNRIDKRNIGDARVPLYNRTLGPGQSEVVSYRFQVPDRMASLTFEARLRYRKTRQDYLRWVYAGKQATPEELSSAQAQQEVLGYVPDPAVKVPEIPIIDISTARVTVPIEALGVAKQAEAADRQRTGAEGGEDSLPLVLRAAPENLLPAAKSGLDLRLNDYGNGWLRFQDPDRAVRAFSVLQGRSVTPMGPVGLARAALQIGDADGAIEALDEAKRRVEAGQRVDPKANAWSRHARIPGLWASALLKHGDYAQAEQLLTTLLQDFPRDRSLWLDLTLSQVQQKKWQDGLTSARQVLALDPDDRTAWQLLSQAQQGVGNTREAMEAGRIFESLREDSSVQGLKSQFLERHPSLRNEAQEKHEHDVEAEPGVASAREKGR